MLHLCCCVASAAEIPLDENRVLSKFCVCLVEITRDTAAGPPIFFSKRLMDTRQEEDARQENDHYCAEDARLVHLLQRRTAARADKDYATADQLSLCSTYTHKHKSVHKNICAHTSQCTRLIDHRCSRVRSPSLLARKVAVLEPQGSRA
jgi:hypothetical protein